MRRLHRIRRLGAEPREPRVGCEKPGGAHWGRDHPVRGLISGLVPPIQDHLEARLPRNAGPAAL